MVKKVVTDNRVRNSLRGQFKNFLDDENIPEQITKHIEDHGIKKGRVLEVYHYLDTSLVELSNKKQVEAYHLHRCLGSIIDLYTPEGELGYSEKKQEPCIQPKYELKALVAEVGKDEYVLLGYYNPNMTGVYAPADVGTYLIKTMTDTSQGGLVVGPQEIKLTSNTGVAFKEQDLGQSNEVVYANSDNVYPKERLYTKDKLYTKSEVYTKEEVDELIHDALEAFKEEYIDDEVQP